MLRWIGYVERMGYDDLAKKIYFQPGAGRRAVSPKNRYLDQVKKDENDPSQKLEGACTRLIEMKKVFWKDQEP